MPNKGKKKVAASKKTNQTKIKPQTNQNKMLMKDHHQQWLKEKKGEREENESGGGQGHPPSSTSQVEIQQHSYSIVWSLSLWQPHHYVITSKTHGGELFTHQKSQGGTTIPHSLQFMFDPSVLKVFVHQCKIKAKC